MPFPDATESGVGPAGAEAHAASDSSTAVLPRQTQSSAFDSNSEAARHLHRAGIMLIPAEAGGVTHGGAASAMRSSHRARTAPPFGSFIALNTITVVYSWFTPSCVELDVFTSSELRRRRHE